MLNLSPHDTLRRIGNHCGGGATTLARLCSRPTAVLIEAVMAPRLPPRPCPHCCALIPGGTRPWPRCACKTTPAQAPGESEAPLPAPRVTTGERSVGHRHTR